MTLKSFGYRLFAAPLLNGEWRNRYGKIKTTTLFTSFSRKFLQYRDGLESYGACEPLSWSSCRGCLNFVERAVQPNELSVGGGVDFYTPHLYRQKLTESHAGYECYK